MLWSAVELGQFYLTFSLAQRSTKGSQGSLLRDDRPETSGM